MSYKKLIIFNSIAVFITTLVVLYNLFTPKVIPTETIYMKESTITIENLENYVLSQSNGAMVYVLIGNEQDQNTIYVQETTLHNVARRYGFTYFNQLEFVSADIDNPAHEQILRDLYYVDNLPAFVSIMNDNNQVSVTSTLVWESNETFSEDEVIEWMQFNGILPLE